jgi:hypothetical protein
LVMVGHGSPLCRRLRPVFRPRCGGEELCHTSHPPTSRGLRSFASRRRVAAIKRLPSPVLPLKTVARGRLDPGHKSRHQNLRRRPGLLGKQDRRPRRGLRAALLQRIALVTSESPLTEPGERFATPRSRSEYRARRIPRSPASYSSGALGGVPALAGPTWRLRRR